MRLLVVTQKVDREDPILGFFHGWLRALAFPFQRITVIGQMTGAYELPGNVQVRSLLKEHGISRTSQILRFWSLIWKMRSEYDVVLVHMTPVWVIIGAPLWWMLKKRVYLWYEARGGGWKLRVALLFVDKVFSASPSGMPVRTDKSVITGHGIDTDRFSPDEDEPRDEKLLITVGRITESKRLPILISCLQSLPPDYRLQIAGKTIAKADDALIRKLRISCEAANIIDRIDVQALAPEDVVSALRHATLFVHASVTGLDKALLEAMSCGCLIVTCAEAAMDLVPPQCLAAPDGKAMAEVARRLLALPQVQQDALRAQVRETVEREHGLNKLVVRLKEEMQAKR